MEEKRYLKRWQHFTFGGANAGMVLSCNFISTFIILFITNFYLDMNPGICGTILLVVKLFDGVTDIIFGNIMDHGHSKHGKAKPWMLRGAIPLGISGILLFCIPDTGNWISYAYLFVFYFIYNAVAYTITNLSYNAMTSLITKNNTERVSINTASYIIVLIANMLINGATLGIVKALGNTADAWRITMAGFTIVGTILIIVGGLTVKEIPFKEAQKEQETIPFKEGIKLATKNPYYFLSIAFNMCNSLIMSACSGLLLYYCNINLGNIELYSTISMLYMTVSMVGLFFAAPMVKKLGTYKCNLYCAMVMFLFSILLIPAGLSGNIILFTAVFSIRCLPLGVVCASTAPIVPSIVEYSYVQTGKHLEGLLFSSVSVGYKIASGISAALPGWILAIIGYKSDAAVQAASTVNGMAIWFFGLPIVLTFVITVMFSKLDVEKAIQKLKESKKGV